MFRLMTKIELITWHSWSKEAIDVIGFSIIDNLMKFRRKIDVIQWITNFQRKLPFYK